jgi:hypothetical protein
MGLLLRVGANIAAWQFARVAILLQLFCKCMYLYLRFATELRGNYTIGLLMKNVVCDQLH